MAYRPDAPPRSIVATTKAESAPAGDVQPNRCTVTPVALSVRQVAEMLGTTPKSIYHRAARNQLPGQFRLGRTLMFRRADLLRFIAEGRGPSPRSR